MSPIPGLELDWPFREEEQPAWNQRGDSPDDWVTQEFKGEHAHEGMDLGIPSGTILRPSATGIVVYATKVDDGSGWGINCVIDYGQDIQVRCAHMNRCDVVIGQGVTRDTVLGISGNTGHSSGPHLHVEVRKGYRLGGARGTPMNPRLWFTDIDIYGTPFPPPPKDWLDMATKEEVKEAYQEVLEETGVLELVRQLTSNDVIGGTDPTVKDKIERTLNGTRANAADPKPFD